MPVTLFKSGDAGTNKTGYAGLKGAAGDLVTVLNSTLCLDCGFTATGGGPTFADQTAAWIQNGAGAALFVANDAVTDIAYFGGRQKFSQLIMRFATVGTVGTAAYEYWNDSAWVAIVSPTDGTAVGGVQLAQDGTVSWSASAQTGWAQTAVGAAPVTASTLYWVRGRWVTAYTQNPVLKVGSIYGWYQPFHGTAGATYRSLLASGVQHYVTVNDNGPNGTSLGKEAWAYAAEALTQYNTDQFTDGSNGVTKPFPSMTQGVSGTTGHVVWRKSADATTARAWKVLMDEKTFYFFALTGDATTQYVGGGFGEIYSLVNGDLYRSFISGRLTENSATITGAAGLNPLCAVVGPTATTFSTTNSCIYVSRLYTGVGGSTLAALVNGLPVPVCAVTNTFIGTGNVTMPNGPDGGVFVGPVFVCDATTHVRGRLRGLWYWGHPTAAANDGDLFAGTGALSAKTFEELKTIGFIDSASSVGNSSVLVLETSDSWEEN